MLGRKDALGKMATDDLSWLPDSRQVQPCIPPQQQLEICGELVVRALGQAGDADVGKSFLNLLLRLARKEIHERLLPGGVFREDSQECAAAMNAAKSARDASLFS